MYEYITTQLNNITFIIDTDDINIIIFNIFYFWRKIWKVLLHNVPNCEAMTNADIEFNLIISTKIARYNNITSKSYKLYNSLKYDITTLYHIIQYYYRILLNYPLQLRCNLLEITKLCPNIPTPLTTQYELLIDYGKYLDSI